VTRIEINGKVIELEGSATIIEAADQAGIPLPRFCYHKKLSVAANRFVSYSSSLMQAFQVTS